MSNTMKRVITLIITVMVSLSASRSFAQDAAMYRRYADKGDKEAMHNLARCYRRGRGTSVDKEKAKELEALAVEHGLTKETTEK